MNMHRIVAGMRGGANMKMRSTASTVTFLHPFRIRGYDGFLPPGGYGIIVEEEQLENVSFVAYRRTGTYLEVKAGPGRVEMRAVEERDLAAAMRVDQATSDAILKEGGASRL